MYGRTFHKSICTASILNDGVEYEYVIFHSIINYSIKYFWKRKWCKNFITRWNRIYRFNLPYVNVRVFNAIFGREHLAFSDFGLRSSDTLNSRFRASRKLTKQPFSCDHFFRLWDLACAQTKLISKFDPAYCTCVYSRWIQDTVSEIICELPPNGGYYNFTMIYDCSFIQHIQPLNQYYISF